MAHSASERQWSPEADAEGIGTRLREDFPILAQCVHGRPLVYLDTAASAQKPRAVLDAMQAVYETGYGNVHRGVHALAARATDAYEAARATVAAFLGAGSADEVVFVRGATEAINLVAASWGRGLTAGDEVLLTTLEHHANIVPWQMLRDATGVGLRVAPIEDDGTLPLDRFAECLTPRTRLVAVSHVSNAIGTVLPVAEIARLAHAVGAVVLVDGCQAVPHRRVDVQALGADFYVFSGHKAYGPTGIGVLWGRGELLRAMPPYQGGGEMIASVTFEETRFKPPPHRFEAGTPAFVEAVGLAAALDYLREAGLDVVGPHERALADRARRELAGRPGVRLVGPVEGAAAIVSFVLDDAHPHDVATVLDRRGVAVRAGHHCAQPLMRRLGVTGTTRASFGMYNTEDDVDALVAAVDEVLRMFAR